MDHILQRQVSHFFTKELANQGDTPITDPGSDDDIESHDQDEVENAICKLKKNKKLSGRTIEVWGLGAAKKCFTSSYWISRSK